MGSLYLVCECERLDQYTTIYHFHSRMAMELLHSDGRQKHLIRRALGSMLEGQ